MHVYICSAQKRDNACLEMIFDEYIMMKKSSGACELVYVRVCRNCDSFP